MSNLITLYNFKFEKGAFVANDKLENVYSISPERIMFIKTKKEAFFVEIEDKFLVSVTEWTTATKAFDKWRSKQ